MGRLQIGILGSLAAILFSTFFLSTRCFDGFNATVLAYGQVRKFALHTYMLLKYTLFYLDWQWKDIHYGNWF